MPSWHQLLIELQAESNHHDEIRRRYLRRLQRVTHRNVIAYYSGWLQKPGVHGVQVTDVDKSGLMTVVDKLDRERGLDLILHTPGGETAATESIVDYLHAMFGSDIRAFVPQLAMSAGTMIACSCREIWMGKQSSLGPIDPQFGDWAAHGVVAEFRRAHREMKEDPSKIPVWQPIIARYHPTLVGECEKSIEWANGMVKDWLAKGMLKEEHEADGLAETIVRQLSDHALGESQTRHLSAERCREMGLKVQMLEQHPRLQDAVLSLHYACIHTLTRTPTAKIIENHKGVAFVVPAALEPVQGASPSGIV